MTIAWGKQTRTDFCDGIYLLDGIITHYQYFICGTFVVQIKLTRFRQFLWYLLLYLLIMLNNGIMNAAWQSKWKD